MFRKRILLLLSSGALATASGTPRGVSPEDSKAYVPSSGNAFTCLTHPFITIPFSRVNDDFCDCPDGSDEPGTSACASLRPKQLAIPGFYCRNKGHTPAYLPLSRINDGICDYDICCDGSDEYAGVGGVKCPSKCAEIGVAARKIAAERNHLRTQGSKKRDELVKKAVVMKKEIEDNIETTKLKIQGTAAKVRELAEKLKEVERSERNKAVEQPAQGGKYPMVVQVAQEKIEEYKGLLTKLREERDEAEKRLLVTEGILETFKEEYNPNFNDEGVKRAVRAWEEYLATGNDGARKNAAEDRELAHIIDEETIDWVGLAGEAEGEGSELHQFEKYLPEGVRNWIHDKLEDTRQFLVDNGMLAPRKTEGRESKVVTAARDALKEAENDNSASENHLKQLQEDLVAPLGPGEVFRPLKRECISSEFGEYRYEYCFLENAHQISRKDNSRTSLGSFVRIEDKDDSSKNEAAGVFESGWEETHEEPLSGMVLKHENGQQCWNGPKRSVSAELYCSAENEIRNVVELEKCVYQFEVGTPAVCTNGKTGAPGDKAKDEL